MGNSNSKVLLVELKGAGEGFDFKAFAEKVVAALAESETAIIVVTDQLKDKTTELAECQKQLQVLQANTEAITQELEAAIDQITDLGTQLSVQQANRGDNSIIVTIKKKQYKLIGDKFHFKGKAEINAETLSKDKAQLEAMLESGSASLIPVTVN